MEIITKIEISANTVEDGTLGDTYAATALFEVSKPGVFILHWQTLIIQRKNVPLSQVSRSFMQELSVIDPSKFPRAGVDFQPELAGPVYDTLTFFADAFLAHKFALEKNKRLFIPHGAVNSWANGHEILTGEDAIDFQVILTGQENNGNKTYEVNHIPTKNNSVKIVAADLQTTPVSGEFPNNWVQVRQPDEEFVFEWGVEYFSTQLAINPMLEIVWAKMSNSVEYCSQKCESLDRSICSVPVRKSLLRNIEMKAIYSSNQK